MNYIIPPTNYPVPSKKVAPDLPDYPLPEGFATRMLILSTWSGKEQNNYTALLFLTM